MAFNLLAAVAPSFIGGIFSSSAQKRQNRAAQKQAQHERAVALEDDASRFERVRDAAVRGGFNPLTALQFGGTTGGFGSGRAMNQVFDWGPTVSQALTAAMPELTGQADVARQREQLEQDLLKAQTIALNTAPAGALVGGGYGSGSASLPTFGGMAAGAATNRKVDRITIGGFSFETDPNTDDVDQSLEPRYGDVAGAAGGALVAYNDLQYNMSRNPNLIDNAVGDWVKANFTIRPNSLADTVRNWVTSIGPPTPSPLPDPDQALIPSGAQWSSGMMPTLGPIR